MTLKSESFYCHTYEFDFSGDVVEGWGGGLYAPNVGVFLACI